MSLSPARVLHIGIARDWREVYAFASRPENMAKWASGLAAGLKRDGEDWVGDGGPLGEIRIRFTPPNDLGVIDHTVRMQTGQEVENHLRVIRNGDGAEVLFTLIRRDDQDDAAYEADAAHIRKDLAALKAVLEGGGA